MQHSAGTKRKPLRHLVIFFVAAVGVSWLISMMPAYRNFIRQDHIDTCFSAMYSAAVWYHLEVEKEQQAGVPEKQIDYEAILRKVVSDNYHIDLDARLSSDQICRAGGTWTFGIDPETHTISIQCTSPGHIWFADQLTEKELDAFREDPKKALTE